MIRPVGMAVEAVNMLRVKGGRRRRRRREFSTVIALIKKEKKKKNPSRKEHLRHMFPDIVPDIKNLAENYQKNSHRSFFFYSGIKNNVFKNKHAYRYLL